MKYLLLLIILPCFCYGQKNDKIAKLDFCGWKINDKDNILKTFKSQFDFLKVQDHDTIVDIGAQSGGFEGCFLAVNQPSDVSFVMVDIDSRCLNEEKVNHMIAHYSGVKGDSIKAHFQIVQNTPDSLWLPLNRFNKAWLFNTLHEIPDQQKMIRDVNAILRSGGEVIVLELSPKREGQLHGGCHKPLLSFDKIKELFTSNGFSLVESTTVDRKKRFDVMMFRFIKN